METLVYETKEQLGRAAADAAAGRIRDAIIRRSEANIILATGVSQFETLENLTRIEDIDWSKVGMFHLDEYVGLSAEHPASFRRYLKERFVDKVSGLKDVFFIDGSAKNPTAECERLGRIIGQHNIDVALVGIGENGHLAFNDPPADFKTGESFIVAELDEKCRAQQVGEGWFGTVDEVPRRAITMTIRRIFKSRCIIASVPDSRKARAVRDAIEGPVTNLCPASILQTHENCKIFLDKQSASLLADES